MYVCILVLFSNTFAVHVFATTQCAHTVDAGLDRFNTFMSTSQNMVKKLKVMDTKLIA